MTATEMGRWLDSIVTAARAHGGGRNGCCTKDPCAQHLSEGAADFSVLVSPGHVLTCVPNTFHQMYVGAFGRAVIQAHQGGSK